MRGNSVAFHLGWAIKDLRAVNTTHTLLYTIVCLCLVCCESAPPDTRASTPSGSTSKTQELISQRDSAAYELSLRQTELAEMEAVTKKPGVIGVSPQWINRHNELKEKIVALQVRLHELDGQLAAESKNSN
jgi:hypothetical protein